MNSPISRAIPPKLACFPMKNGISHEGISREFLEHENGMSNGDLNWIANFIWGIPDDVLRDLYVQRAAPGWYRHDRDRESVPGEVAAALQSALCGPAGPGRRSASAEAGGRGSDPYPVHQDHTVPAP